MATTDETAKPSTIFYKGSCACKRITYTCASWPRAVTVCHCVTCRKLSGAAYQVFVHAVDKAVTFHDRSTSARHQGLPAHDAGGIRLLHLSNFAERAVCVDCCTHLGMRYLVSPDETALTVGTVDDDDEAGRLDDEVRKALKVAQHIYVSQKVWWVDVEGDGVPCWDRMPRDFEEVIQTWVAEQGR